MAEVYLATDRRNGKNVALKVLPSGFGDAAARIRRFEREAKALAPTSHANVVAIYEVGKYNPHPVYRYGVRRRRTSARPPSPKSASVPGSGMSPLTSEVRSQSWELTWKTSGW